MWLKHKLAIYRFRFQQNALMQKLLLSLTVALVQILMGVEAEDMQTDFVEQKSCIVARVFGISCS